MHALFCTTCPESRFLRAGCYFSFFFHFIFYPFNVCVAVYKTSVSFVFLEFSKEANHDGSVTSGNNGKRK